MNLIDTLRKLGFKKIGLFLAVAGPGLVVMLADTDASSIVTAAQSGAVWGYKLLSIQLILIPILFIVQELTVRLGLGTGKGHGELIAQHFGKFWAWISVGTLIISCVGALISELSGIVSVGNLFGIKPHFSMALTIAFLVLLVLTRSYNSVERVALACGAFELVYVFIAWCAHPAGSELIQGLRSAPLHNSNYLYFVSANIGAVIMPWMVFYQQSAVVDKGVKKQHLKFSRLETIIGAVITQAIMAAIVIACAATIGKTHGGEGLDSIEQISKALTPFLGDNIGRLLFALGMLGASLIATIVVLLASAWSVGEITGFRHSLQNHPKDAPWFYGVYFVTLLLGGILVSSDIVHLVNLNVAINVMNALLLPIVLGFLFVLAYKFLPEPYKLSGRYAVFVGIVIAITSGFGLIAGILGIFGFGS